MLQSYPDLGFLEKGVPRERSAPLGDPDRNGPEMEAAREGYRKRVVSGEFPRPGQKRFGNSFLPLILDL